MNADLVRLGRWMRRAQPPRRSLVRALVAGTVASVTNAGLFVGAIALLVVSATRPGLRAVAGVLIIIEVLAFVRSPLRFSERLSAHQLGFAAVTRWRRWLVLTVGQWDFRRWRTYAAGDLLERALADTDELQDLWLRCVVPTFATLATLALGDLLIGLLSPHGQWWINAGLLAVTQLLGVAGLIATIGPYVRADRALRDARGRFRSTIVELSAVTPELALLGAVAFLEARASVVRDELDQCERRLRRQRRASIGIGILTTTLGLSLLIVHHPRAAPTWMVVVALLTLATYDSLATVRSAVDTAVSISAAAERLDGLDGARRAGHEPWPTDSTLRVTGVSLCERDRVVLDDISFVAPTGRRIALSGPSGVGKSTLLRALANLDPPERGTITLGATALADIDEGELRRRVAYVPSEAGLTRGFAHDVVGLGRASTRDSTLDLAHVGLWVNPTTRWDELSRGERQRVAIVRALVTDPVILLLDEPTSGLGREETDDVLSLLASTGATVIIATHDPHVVRWCDEVIELRDQSPVDLSR